jgi:uncharacterized protein (TIGR03067 family)
VSTQFVLGLALVVGAPALKPSAKAPAPPSLVGEWAFAAVIEGGEPEPSPPGQSLTFLADGTFVAQEDGQCQETGTYTTDPKADLPALDLVEHAAGGTLRGVWKVQGDTLTLCVTRDPKGGRPSAFASPVGSDWVLVALKRVKK